MALLALSTIWHIDFVMKNRIFSDELVVWGFHTEEQPSTTLMLDICQAWWELPAQKNFTTGVDLDRIVIKSWTGTKWLTLSQRIFPIRPIGGTTGPMPPQIAVAVSYMTNLLGGPAGDNSRYNRSFVGYIAASKLGPQGKLAGGFSTDLLNSFGDLNTRLKTNRAIPPVGKGGLVVASVQEAAAADADFIKVGQVFDTQRRRRNGLSEDYAVGALP